jgi:hypothetical protein
MTLKRTILSRHKITASTATGAAPPAPPASPSDRSPSVTIRKRTSRSRVRRLLSDTRNGWLAVAALIAPAIGVAGCGTTSTSTTTSTSSSATPAAYTASSSSAGSNARSGPAAGGSIGKVSSMSTSGFELLTSAGGLQGGVRHHRQRNHGDGGDKRRIGGLPGRHRRSCCPAEQRRVRSPLHRRQLAPPHLRQQELQSSRSLLAGDQGLAGFLR